MIHIKDLNLNELKDFLLTLGEKSFRAKQIYSWIYKGAKCYEDMSDLPCELREKLSEITVFDCLKTGDLIYSENDETCKLLFYTEDGEGIESVFMKYKYGNSLCVSSQAGCKMRCTFCASGMKGLSRDLTPGEMSDQLIITKRIIGEDIRHIVIMGTGEPFDNYENIRKFIENICDPAGLGLSKRNITVSTCGIIPVMERFSRELPQVNLAVSLHAPNDDIRNRIMPVNKKYSTAELIEASKKYISVTGRRITFEYALIKGVNDSRENGEELAGILKGMNCHVNLITLNHVDEPSFHASDRNTALRFMKILEDKKIQVTLRREMGGDIDAACGQLRLKNT